MNRRQLAQAKAMNRKALEAYAKLGRPAPNCVEIRDWGPLDRTLPNEKLLPKRHQIECGTHAGLKQHRRLKEKPCRACLEFRNIANRKGGGRAT
jgi:hypothetical protein